MQTLDTQRRSALCAIAGRCSPVQIDMRLRALLSYCSSSVACRVGLGGSDQLRIQRCGHADPSRDRVTPWHGRKSRRSPPPGQRQRLRSQPQRQRQRAMTAPGRPSHWPGPHGRLRMATPPALPAESQQNALPSCVISTGEPGKSPSLLRTGSVGGRIRVLNVANGLRDEIPPRGPVRRGPHLMRATPHACITFCKIHAIDAPSLFSDTMGGPSPPGLMHAATLLHAGQRARRRCRSSRRTTRPPRCLSDTWCASRSLRCLYMAIALGAPPAARLAAACSAATGVHLRPVSFRRLRAAVRSAAMALALAAASDRAPHHVLRQRFG